MCVCVYVCVCVCALVQACVHSHTNITVIVTCTGVDTNFGRSCSDWQYNSNNLSSASLGLQDLFFIASWIIAVALVLLGIILPWTISRV